MQCFSHGDAGGELRELGQGKTLGNGHAIARGVQQRVFLKLKSITLVGKEACNIV